VTKAPPRSSSQPWLHQHGTEVQRFGTVRLFPLSLSYEARMYSCQRLNQILADTQILYAVYKKHHWLVRGATFYQLHLLLDKQPRNNLTWSICWPSGFRRSAAWPSGTRGKSAR
jgi:starvation-inducible DNA-binding protein